MATLELPPHAAPTQNRDDQLADLYHLSPPVDEPGDETLFHRLKRSWEKRLHRNATPAQESAQPRIPQPTAPVPPVVQNQPVPAPVPPVAQNQPPQHHEVAGQQEGSDRATRITRTRLLLEEKIEQIHIRSVHEFPNVVPDKPLEDKFREAEAKIHQFLNTPESPLRGGSTMVVRGWAAGETAYICIAHKSFTNPSTIKTFHLVFWSTEARRYCFKDPRLEICYKSLHGFASPGSSIAPAIRQNYPTTYTLCGSLASDGTGSRQQNFTIGGVLEVEGELFALTAWHNREAPETEKDLHPQPIEELIGRMIDENKLAEDLEPPVIGVPFDSESEQEVSEVVPRGGTNDELVVGGTGSRGLGDVFETGSEWALIRIIDPLMKLPNCVELQSDVAADSSKIATARRYYLYDYAATTDRVSESTVHILAGASGTIEGMISRKTSPMILDSGELIDVWTVILSHGQGRLRQGDSGSWVIEAQSGVVFGHVIAGTDDTAYVLPLSFVIASVRSHAQLPSPFQCLAELCTTCRATDQASRAEQYADEAMQDDVLDHAANHGIAQLIKVHCHQKIEPVISQPGLTPRIVFRQILQHFGTHSTTFPDLVKIVEGAVKFNKSATRRDIANLLLSLGFHEENRKPTCPTSLPHTAVTNAFLHYTGCLKISERHGYLLSFSSDQRLKILARLERSRRIRAWVEESENADQGTRFVNLMNNWRLSKGLSPVNRESVASGNRSSARVSGFQQHLHEAFSAPIDMADTFSATDELRTHFMVRIMEFSGSSTIFRDFPPNSRTITEASEEDTTAIRYIHVPANNVEWVNDIISRLNAEKVAAGESWRAMQKGQVKSRHMEPVCLDMSSEEESNSSLTSYLSMPYLSWESRTILKNISSQIEKTIEMERQKMKMEDYGLYHHTENERLREGGNHTKPQQRGWPQLRKLSRRATWTRRPFCPNPLGQLLLDAAELYREISLFSDKRLVEDSLFSEQLHLRRPLHQACASPYIDNDRLYHASIQTDPIMVDQLWMWIVDSRTIVTSFPRRYGRIFGEDRDIYGSLIRRLATSSERSPTTVYEIAFTVLDECIGSFFQSPQSRQSILQGPSAGFAAVNRQISEIGLRLDAYQGVLDTLDRPSVLAYTSSSSQNFRFISKLRTEIREVIEELQMVHSLLETQSRVVGEFERTIDRRLSARRNPKKPEIDEPEPSKRLTSLIIESALTSRIAAQTQEVQSMAQTATQVQNTINQLAQQRDEIRLVSGAYAGKLRQDENHIRNFRHQLWRLSSATLIFLPLIFMTIILNNTPRLELLLPISAGIVIVFTYATSHVSLLLFQLFQFVGKYDYRVTWAVLKAEVIDYWNPDMKRDRARLQQRLREATLRHKQSRDFLVSKATSRDDVRPSSQPWAVRWRKGQLQVKDKDADEKV
ncbi:hypothetical protein B0H63DRAFT_464874 [Podospora didyma]|uniref:Uncharacterized protein n=1 Tax=Podospora didyma TaxID=330526 RepID=A0AAE0NYT2_9PEZI|nr:hypothetical protein B0H63DRAFT_464874 [Podospora didyma]